MRILHLTDTHLFADPAARHYDRIATAEALRAVLESLSGLRGVDLVVHSGDASEDGSVASYRLLHEMLDPFAARLGAKLVVAMGNHDVPSAYAQVAGPGDHAAPYQDRVVTTGDGARAVVLDTSVPGAGYGHLDPVQLDWLRRILAVPARRGTVLVLHHPPLVAATPLLRALDLDGLDDLAAAIEGTDVRVILSGHYHHAVDGRLGAVPVHVAPGVTNVVDPLGADLHERAFALSGASLVEVDGRSASSAPRITTSVWPNAGDLPAAAADGAAAADAADGGGPATASGPLVPVYDFDEEAVRGIVEAAGRRHV